MRRAIRTPVMNTGLTARWGIVTLAFATITIWLATQVRT